MSAPLFLVAPEALGADRVLLDGPEGRHAATVQRLTTGEEVVVADGSGRGARCRVIAAGRDQLVLEVLEDLAEPDPQPRLVLVQALAKGDRDLQAIEAATELDVDEVLPWQADRSIVRWRGDRGDKARGKWEQTLRAATKQSRRLRLPTLGDPLTRRSLADRAATADLTLVLHEEASAPLADVELPSTGEVLLVVGPEGGISPDELRELTDAGARAVRLGRTVLRSGTAGPAALAVLQSRGRWR